MSDKLIKAAAEFLSRDTSTKGAVTEAGPFSYGKPPKKGSIADLAAKKRKEQERKKPAIEPKDQMVGVAKVTKEEVEEIEEDFTKMKNHELKQWINNRQQNAMAANLSSKRQSQLDQAQAELKKRKKVGVSEGLMASMAAKMIKAAANTKTPQEIANSHIRALNKKAPGTKMEGHPNFSKFKSEVHSYVSSAKTGEEALKRTMDNHVVALGKKHFND